MIKLSIIIPIFNEKNTALPLLKSVYLHKIKGIEKEIVIIEDNSSDGTREIVKKFVKNKKNITLILQKVGMGKGTAVRKGLAKATGDIVLIQDADLEYDVSDYEKLITPIIEGKTSFVLGSRHLRHHGKTDWLIRRFKGRERIYAHFMNVGGLFFHKLFNFVYGVKLTDPTTMYKVFKRNLLKEVHLEGKYFELDFEIVGKFIRLGHIPLEVPVNYHARGNSEGKKVRFSRDVWRWVITIFKVRFMPLKITNDEYRCRVCNGKKLSMLFPFYREFTIYNCQKCNTDSIFPDPSYELIQKFHDESYVSAYKDESFRGFKIKDFKNIFNKINTTKKIKTSLEIGCANAYLTEYLLDIGVDAYGIEIEKAVAGLAQKRLSKKIIFTGDFTVMNFGKRFDLIVMFDLLEHIKDPIEALKIVKKILKPSGHALILTPNIETWKRTFFKKFWTGYYLEHFNCFSGKSMRHLAKVTGLKMVNLENYHKLVNFHYFIRKLIWKYPKLKLLNFLSQTGFNPEFKINDDSMLVILKNEK